MDKGPRWLLQQETPIPSPKPHVGKAIGLSLMPMPWASSWPLWSRPGPAASCTPLFRMARCFHHATYSRCSLDLFKYEWDLDDIHYLTSTEVCLELVCIFTCLCSALRWMETSSRAPDAADNRLNELRYHCDDQTANDGRVGD